MSASQSSPQEALFKPRVGTALPTAYGQGERAFQAEARQLLAFSQKPSPAPPLCSARLR